VAFPSHSFTEEQIGMRAIKASASSAGFIETVSFTKLSSESFDWVYQDCFIA
jgi:hypothetical protein